MRYEAKNEFEEQTSGSKTLAIDTSKGSPDMGYEQHLETYRDFVRFTKYAIVFIAIILIGMKIFLV